MDIYRFYVLMESVEPKINDCHQKSSEVSSNWLLVNGVQLHYTCRGSGTHPLLLIPGALGIAEQQYKPQLDHFGREGSGFKVVSFDPRGYGESCGVARPKCDSSMTDAEDAHKLMLSLSLPSFSVLGLCSGGRAGLILASLYPQSVKKLVVFGTRSYVTNDEVKMYEKIRDVESWEAKIRDPLAKIYGPSLQDRWSAHLDELQNYLAVNNGDICTTALPKISCPTLIVHGANDVYTRLFQAEYLREHVTGSLLVVMEDGRHMLHLKLYQRFNATVGDFLTSGS